jgi:hypothetical protein
MRSEQGLRLDPSLRFRSTPASETCTASAVRGSMEGSAHDATTDEGGFPA